MPKILLRGSFMYQIGRCTLRYVCNVQLRNISRTVYLSTENSLLQ